MHVSLLLPKCHSGLDGQHTDSPERWATPLCVAFQCRAILQTAMRPVPLVVVPLWCRSFTPQTKDHPYAVLAVFVTISLASYIPLVR